VRWPGGLPLRGTGYAGVCQKLLKKFHQNFIKIVRMHDFRF